MAEARTSRRTRRSCGASMTRSGGEGMCPSHTADWAGWECRAGALQARRAIQMRWSLRPVDESSRDCSRVFLLNPPELAEDFERLMAGGSGHRQALPLIQ